MLQPKRTKYRKQFRGRMKGKSISGSRLNFGEFGLKSLGRGWLTSAQLEATRRAITNYTKRKAKVWIRVFPDKPVTQKGSGAPMGAGKGDVDHWVAVAKPGRIIVEVGGVPENIAKESLKMAAFKLPVKTKLVTKV